MKYPIAKSQQEPIPNDIKILGERSFESNKYLTTITIPSGITEIKEFAFRYCKAMTTFTVDSNNQHYESENGLWRSVSDVFPNC